MADNSADFWDGSLDKAIHYDEFGGPCRQPEVWSGSNSIGNFSGATCGNWSDSSTSGTYGNATSPNPNWLQESFQSCSNTARIYGISPALTVVPEPSTWLLAAFGLVALAARGWLRWKR